MKEEKKKKSFTRDENFFNIQGWMVSKLKLKGNELLVFAVIYGFSKNGKDEFSGSLRYLCDLTGITRPTAIKVLKSLISNNLILKSETEINGIKLNAYKVSLQVVKKFNSRCKEPLQGGGKEILQGGSKETLPNNKYMDNKANDNKDIKYIVGYLNRKVGTAYKPTSENTVRHINARYNEGFKTEDFITVIDKKCDDWLKTDYEKYLRPETLFGTKFENYLNARPNKKTAENKKSTLDILGEIMEEKIYGN